MCALVSVLGHCDEGNSGQVVSMTILPRSDKRKDRVEISAEQLTAATATAEKLAQESGLPLRVIGWYHSHPHITVWPSHVDVRTQLMYQQLDPNFVGLIIACYNTDTHNEGHITITCFQSDDISYCVRASSC
eukprot:m.143221 g.143221  ORF g.143221 m.143221 type:complete len:132 (+) comp52639_c0_seq13:276-671(+)